MDRQEILKRTDHTILAPTTTLEQVKNACDLAIQYHTASVCIPPRYVKRAGDYVGNRLKICTVIGFPYGYSTPEVKIFETEDAIRNGADEVDVILNLGMAKAGDWEGILQELKAIKTSCKGRIFKVTIESCLFTEQEKITICQVISMSGADFIKTSTGFSSGGATLEDVSLFKEHISPDVRIKAAGGIKTFEEAEAFLQAGAKRIGSSSLVGLMEADQ